MEQASAKTGTPTAREQLAATSLAYSALDSCTSALLDSTVVLQNSVKSNTDLLQSVNAGNRAMERGNDTINQCLSSWRESEDTCSREFSESNNENAMLPLLDVIRQHALAVGLENLTLADDGLVYEGEPDGNGALYFRDCSDDEHGCQEMAIETTVYSTDPTAELFLDKPVNLDEIEF